MAGKMADVGRLLGEALPLDATENAEEVRDLTIPERCEEMIAHALELIRTRSPLAPILLLLFEPTAAPRVGQMARWLGRSRTTIYRWFLQ